MESPVCLEWDNEELACVSLRRHWREARPTGLADEIKRQFNERDQPQRRRLPTFGPARDLGIDELRVLRELLDAYNDAVRRMAEEPPPPKRPGEKIGGPPLTVYYANGKVHELIIDSRWFDTVTAIDLTERLETLLKGLPAQRQHTTPGYYDRAVDNLNRFWGKGTQ